MGSKTSVGRQRNSGDQNSNSERWKPELVVGLVGATGTNLRAAAEAVRASLLPYGYQAERVGLSSLMREVEGGDSLAEPCPEDERIRKHMDAGDEIRNQSGRNDAVVGLAIGFVSAQREEKHAGAPATGTAFVLDSLKHPDEVAALRRVYRNRFILISVHSPTEARMDALQSKIAESHGAPQRASEFADAARELMERDEHDADRDFGQNVRDTFTEGDAYVSTTPQAELPDGVNRYLQLFFGDPFLTPTRDEYAMFQAHAAALRSADLSRQVGAAIRTSEGDVVAVGCNEVPRAFGGQYWPGDSPDKRDFQLGYDSNAKSRDEALEKAFDRLRANDQLGDGVSLEDFISSLSGTRLANITEFGRTVHAEMAALLDAGRRGAAVKGHELFSTTFPCHNCARHIIGAGIKTVVYREPYEKSLAAQLHPDAIVVDPVDPPRDKVEFRRFVGVGPPRYFDLFTKVERKDGSGNRIPWSKEKAVPRLVTTEVAYLTNEEDFLDELRDSIALVDLKQEENHE